MTRLAEPDPALVTLLDDFFAERASSAGASAEQHHQDTFASVLWEETHSLGLTLVGVDEATGGSGGTLLDGLAVLVAGGRHAVNLPLAETQLAAHWMVRAGLDAPRGPATVAALTGSDSLRLDGDHLRGTTHHVPWARWADTIVVLVEEEPGSWLVAAVDPTTVVIDHGHDLAGAPSDSVTVDSRVQVARIASGEDPRWLGGLARAAQIAGAVRGLSDLTWRYADERHQFGRPISSFQAVQEHLVQVAEAAELAQLSMWRAALDPSSFTVACSKLVADECARTAAAAAHQAHGAIGMTREYPLHRFTSRLHAWRHEFGPELRLSGQIGTAARGAASFAELLTGRPEVTVAWPQT